MRFEHRLTFTADCAAERPDDATVERANAHLETLVQPMLRGKMDGYTAATLMETGLFTAVDVDREHHWVSGDGYTQLLSTMEFPAPKSTRRLGGVIWSGFAADTSARNKLHEFRGMRYTVRGETKAMHGDMVCYGLNGAQRGLSGLPAEQRRYPHPYNPGGLEMSEEARELFVDHAEDFTTVLEKYAPALVDSKRRVVASAAADRYSISEKAPAFAFAISISYVASPHDDHRETHPSAILFVCRESVHDWVFQAGPYLIRLPSTPGMARLVVLNGVSVKHGTCYSTINPDHANLGSVLLMEHDMMVEISKWNVDHGRLHTTMSAFAPGYYKGMYATNGCVNPQLLDQFTLQDVDGSMVHNFDKEGSEQVLVRRLMNMLLPIADEHVYEFGANIGRNTIHMAKYLMTKGGKITTFEPSVEICKVLRENVKSNGVESCVTVMEGALSRTPQLFMKDMFIAETEASLRGTVEEEGEVSVTCIDTLPDQPTGLVFDCEGAYTDILRDFPEIMERVRFVFCELDGSKVDTKEMTMYLHDQGLHEVFMNDTYAIFVAKSALKEVAASEKEEEEGEGEEEVIVEDKEGKEEEEEEEEEEGREKAKPKAKAKAKAAAKSKAAVKPKATGVKPKAKGALEAATVATRGVRKALKDIKGRCG